MDEMASLSQEIEFHEKFRGYDPDEVDAYVDRVRRTAALAMGRISELHDRVAASESLVASSRANSAEETLGRTLILAQQTADSVVAEAEAEATRLITEATDQASESVSAASEQSSRILAEAETDRREMIRTAEADARLAAAEARDLLQADVSGLATTREYLEDDIEILEKHVREQRENLSLVVSSLNDLIEQPQAFRLDPPPATSGVEPATPVEAERVVEAEPVVEAEQVVEAERVVEAEPVDEAEVLLATDQFLAEQLDPTDDPDDAAQASETESRASEIDEIIDLDGDAVPEPPRLTTAADLGDQPAARTVPLFADTASGDRTEQFAQHVVGLSESDMLADDDDALSAFFDQDDDPDRSWFGRRN